MKRRKPRKPRLMVVKLPVSNRRSVDVALDTARQAGLTDVVIIGYDAKGELWTNINFVDGGHVLWMLELCKAKLMYRSAQRIFERLP